MKSGVQGELFELPDVEGIEHQHTFKPLSNRIWTENKARLIERYLYYFVQITRHGTYIDGFAGPQDASNPDSWAARLVLESRPAWLRNFYLCELNDRSYDILNQLVVSQPTIPKRKILHWHGDFNVLLPDILSKASISDTEASFCLLDQRTFECHWKTVETLSKVKSKNKIELFYFFAAGWLTRSITASKERSVVDKWWGAPDWHQLIGLNGTSQAQMMRDRMKRELGYEYIFNWPIFEHAEGGKVMYYMIHASDHMEAPNLMARAYRQAVYAHEPPEQFMLELSHWRGDGNPVSDS